MTSSWFVSLREGVAVEPGAEGERVFQGSNAKITFKHVAAGLDAALEQLTSTGATTDSLAWVSRRLSSSARRISPTAWSMSNGFGRYS